MGKLSADEIFTRVGAALTSDSPKEGLMRLFSDGRREANREVKNRAAEYERKRAEEYAKEDAAKLEEKNSVETTAEAADETEAAE